MRSDALAALAASLESFSLAGSFGEAGDSTAEVEADAAAACAGSDFVMCCGRQLGHVLNRHIRKRNLCTACDFKQPLPVARKAAAATAKRADTVQATGTK